MRSLGAVLMALLAVAAPAAAADLEVLGAAAAAGSFGLQVSIGSTCTTPDLVTVPPGTADGYFEACQMLTAVDVEVSTDASFVAGDSIVLGSGFSVAGGATFSAVTDSLMPSELASVSTRSPIAEQTFNARFHLRLDSLSLANGEEVEHLRAVAADGSDIFRVILRRQSGQNLLVLGARQDGGGEILTPAGQEVGLPAGWNLIELSWRAGAGDGRLLVSVNQGAQSGLVDLANSLAEVETVRWGAVDGTFAGSPGRLEVDGFSAWR